MKLKALLAKQADIIVERWFDAVAAQYPPDTSSFLKNRQDPFHNPVRANTVDALKKMTTALLGDMDPEAVKKAVDPAIRIRAVQRFSAAESIAFIFTVKQVFTSLLEAEFPEFREEKSLWRQYQALDRRVDKVALIAMDVYTECREKLYHLKNHMEREGVYKAFRRAGLVQEDPDGAKIEIPARCHEDGASGNC